AGQLISARNSILSSCICSLIAQEDRPQPCDVSTIDQISDHSPITHLVLIKGLPARLYETGWSSDSEEPSLDYYLAALIYRDSDIFGAGNNGTIGINYQIHYLNSGHFRSLSAATDRTVAYGRVEAINNERTKSLIDRTLLAEQH